MKRILFLLVLISSIASAQVTVTFKVTLPASTPEPKTIYLAGSFNGWSAARKDWQLNADASGMYQLSVSIPAGSYEYKFTRGDWDKVECSATGAPIANRTLH